MQATLPQSRNRNMVLLLASLPVCSCCIHLPCIKQTAIVLLTFWMCLRALFHKSHVVSANQLQLKECELSGRGMACHCLTCLRAAFAGPGV
jgi:hypothetical protein